MKFNFVCIFVLLFFVSFVSSSIIEDSESTYVSVNLHKGWNLVAGLSFNEEDLYSGSDGFEGIVSAYYFDNGINDFVEVYPTYSAGEVSADELYSQAFWVYSSQESNLIYRVSSPFTDNDFSWLSEGYHLLPINQFLYGQNVDEVFGSYGEYSVAYWDAGLQSWNIIDSSSNFDFDSEDNLVGEGIYVRIGPLSEEVEFPSEETSEDWSEVALDETYDDSSEEFSDDSGDSISSDFGDEPSIMKFVFVILGAIVLVILLWGVALYWSHKRVHHVAPKKAIVDYLLAHSHYHHPDVLKKKILESGYSPEDYEVALKEFKRHA